MPSYCEVALPVPLDRTFTYAVRDGETVCRGMRVIAPFRNEKLIGVVTGVSDAAPVDFEAKPIEAILDEEPLLSEPLFTLAEWIAQYYLAPLGEVLRGMLPLTAEVRRTVYYRITDLGRDVLARSLDGDSSVSQVSKASPPSLRRRPVAGGPEPGVPSSRRRGKVSPEELDMERRVLERLAAGEPVKVSTLRTATAVSLPALAGLVRKRWIARETSAMERDARRTERFAVLIPESRLPTLTEKQQAILAELAACGGELQLAELRRKELPSSTLQTLVRRGLVRIEERAAAFRLGGIEPSTEPMRLNESQTEALASIASGLGGFHAFLLHGVTGSGKTAVYLAAMQRALDRGLASILLVPEIGLTPQTVGLLDAAFGARVALLHSALTPEERSEQWRRIHRGDAPIVVGTRSAIFAPVPNLGLICVDEEHD
ncbi:MAG: DEAD/DEAH box helicase, partial [Terracidiphilus sp.]